MLSIKAIKSSRRRELNNKRELSLHTLSKEMAESRNKISKLVFEFHTAKRERRPEVMKKILDIHKETVECAMSTIHTMVQTIIDGISIVDYEKVDVENDRERGYLDGQLSYYKELCDQFGYLPEEIKVRK